MQALNSSCAVAVLAESLPLLAGLVRVIVVDNASADDTMVAARLALPEGDLCAGFISGAVMLLRMKVVSDFGGFDPDIFLFYEYTELCLRAVRIG